MLSTRFDEALGFAAELHRGQTRKGSDIPYLSHLLAVAALVIEHGGDEDQAIAALLHDAVEDQGGMQTAEAIDTRFGSRVLRIVMECSDSSDGQKAPWAERKRAYLAGIATKSADACLVTAADKLHNARCIVADHMAVGDAVWTRFTAGKEDVAWYYTSLAGALTAALPCVLTELLDSSASDLASRAGQRTVA